MFFLTENVLEDALLKKEEVDKEIEEKKRKLEKLNAQFDKLKTFLDQKGYAWTRRQNTLKSTRFLNCCGRHTDEMLLESSVFTVCGKECTMEFQPSADMSWQSWACNQLNQAATYHPLTLCIKMSFLN